MTATILSHSNTEIAPISPHEFVDLYELLHVSPDTPPEQMSERISALYTEAQRNLDHHNFRKRFYYQELYEVHLPKAHAWLLAKPQRAYYDACLQAWREQRDFPAPPTRPVSSPDAALPALGASPTFAAPPAPERDDALPGRRDVPRPEPLLTEKVAVDASKPERRASLFAEPSALPKPVQSAHGWSFAPPEAEYDPERDETKPQPDETWHDESDAVNNERAARKRAARANGFTPGRSSAPSSNGAANGAATNGVASPNGAPKTAVASAPARPISPSVAVPVQPQPTPQMPPQSVRQAAPQVAPQVVAPPNVTQAGVETNVAPVSQDERNRRRDFKRRALIDRELQMASRVWGATSAIGASLLLLLLLMLLVPLLETWLINALPFVVPTWAFWLAGVALGAFGVGQIMRMTVERMHKRIIAQLSKMPYEELLRRCGA